MILYYALGGGLGHLVRARAVAYTLGLHPVTVLSASPRAADPRLRGPLGLLPVPAALEQDPRAFGAWLLDQIARLSPAALYVDAFPGGILGELCDLPLPLPCFHLARLLRLPTYGRRLRGRLPRYRRTFLLEPLPDEHLALLRGCSDALEPLALHDAPAAPPVDLRRELDDGPGRPLWLVVHSEPASEVLRLLRLAAAEAPGARLCLLSPERPPGLPDEVAHRDLIPAAPLLPQADGVVTACGFNAMREAAGRGLRHRFLPMPRRLDDQFLRARRYRGTTAGG